MFKKLMYLIKWHIIRPQAFLEYEKLLSCDRMTKTEHDDFHEKSLRRVVLRAMRQVPFYRSLYARVGFHEEDIGSPGWFERLPIVTKEDLRESFERMINPTVREHCRVSTTGGSTGAPTKAGYDGRLAEESYSWRVQRMFGVQPWDDHAYIWRDTRSTVLSRFVNALLWWPTKHIKLDASVMTDANVRSFLRRYRRLQPALLQGYVGAIAHMARFVIDHGMQDDVRNANLKVVWTTSAPLSSVQRRLIENVFGAPVCDQYGSCEIRWIAQQCRMRFGLHVNTEHVHIEFVDDANRPVNGCDYGRVLLTNLEDDVFPLIRYENGDRGRWYGESCPCGDVHPVIDAIKGRESDSFVLPSGKIVNGEYLTTIFDDAPDLVSAFRVLQHKDLSVTVEYIPIGAEAKIQKCLERFSLKFCGEVPVRFAAVSEIPHDRGKTRFVVKEY